MKKKQDTWPGLKIVGMGTGEWYGNGYCGICGDRDHLFPRAVRWWDADDGWRHGVLCDGCFEDAKHRGPRPDDYAVKVAEREIGENIDTICELLGDDQDGAHTMIQDLFG